MRRVVRRLAAPTVLIACAAALLAAPTAAAKLKLPPGANAAPVLPPGMIPAEHPPVGAVEGQGRSVSPFASVARASSQGLGDEGKRPFWATVNICDTEKSPNGLGVRTSVPGNGSDERIYARFRAQWWSGFAQEWKTVGGSGVTDWVYVGQADDAARQAGWTFHFMQPPEGTTYVMRGVVEVRWRDEARAARKSRKARKAGRAGKGRKARRAQRWSVVRERTLLTETGMRGVRGGDPEGLSKAMCLIW